jgi:hypothetical protein
MPAWTLVVDQPWVRVADFIPAEDALYGTLVERFRGAGVTRPVAYHEVRVLNGAGVTR